MKLVPFPTSETIIAVDAWTAPVWQAAARGQLTAPRCSACGKFHMQPAPFCPSCLSQEFTWPILSGRGSLYSYTFSKLSRESQDGYCVAVIEPEDAPGIRIVSNMVDVDSDDLAVDMLVEIAFFQPLADNFALPMFRPLKGAARPSDPAPSA